MIKKLNTNLEKLSIVSDELNFSKQKRLITSLVEDMKDTMIANKLSSLAAIEIGKDKRVIALRFGKTITPFINPIYSKPSKGFELCRETCNCLGDTHYLVPRNNNITITYQDIEGKEKTSTLVGMGAKVFQQCMDHLNGILLSDIGLEIDEQFDSAAEEEKQEVINYYIDTLRDRATAINSEIAQDNDLSRLRNNLNIREKVAMGLLKFEETVQDE